MTQHRSIHLFRKGLRLHDNPSLVGVLESSEFVYPVFILDRAFMEGAMRIGVLRWRFILQSLEDLHHRLQALGSRLYVVQGPCLGVLRRLVAQWGVTQLSLDTEVEPHYLQQDQEIQALAGELSLTLRTAVAHTLYDVRRIVRANGGQPPLTYKKFLKVLSGLGEPSQPARDITAEDFQKCRPPLEEKGRCGVPSLEDEGRYGVPSLEDEGRYGLPSLEELGLHTEHQVLWPGGETQALQRLHTHMESQGWVNNFSRPRTIPNSLLPSTTGLSPYLALGCLSARTFYHRLSKIHAQSKNHSLPPGSLQGQTLWREFFYTIASATPNFSLMEGNPICLQIDWDQRKDLLHKWTMGQTGFPWIDAIMTQLRQEGWIHHLARHAVACFLTRGDLWINWEEGLKVFEDELLDADYSINAGNWMWLSASAFYHQLPRIFCPVRFGRRTDPTGEYLRKYLPVLKDFPSKYIYEPWKAPEEVQLQAGCVIGKDYPLPVVDHKEASQKNLEMMTQVHNQQESTARLTRDVVDDPMKMRLERNDTVEDEDGTPPTKQRRPDREQRAAPGREADTDDDSRDTE
ncbi:cryptochrome circadian regulator 4 [Hypomesus transpacificus]|uniref:cryptochrome circadian regulator 4 n=1 Tax=Hypomesus transpacificus TaxID=137520 RepID=UPI001F081DD2|nr:cryptochrome circadian regulator 4 [Hypomesus transpacificus]XP_046881747.1 cryptochrome circadian regulator 4 [Hypomesus transpacificus]